MNLIIKKQQETLICHILIFMLIINFFINIKNDIKLPYGNSSYIKLYQ